MKKGSALVLVLIAVTVVALIIGSLFTYSITEKKLNHEALVWLQAKTVAEAVVDLGMGQLVERFNTVESFPHDTLRYDKNPLYLTDRFFDYYADDTFGGNNIAKVELPVGYNKNSPPGTYPVELVGGAVSSTLPVFINPNDPAYDDEPDLKGTTILTTSVTILGKATVRDFRNKTKIAYASADLLVRDAPLFSHAIFYNMDLEIAPSPNMNIIGKVHTNGDLWYMMASGTNTLNFQNLVSTAGKLRFGRMPQSGLSNTDGKVFFMSGKDGSGNPIMVNNRYNGAPIDEVTMGDTWRAWSANTYNYWVQTGAHGMSSHKSIAMQDYVRDDPSTPEVDDALNYAYQMIMPAASQKPSDANQYEIEKQKFAYKAGLTLEVDPSSGTVRAYTYEREGKEIAYDNGGNAKKVDLNLPTVQAGDIVKLKPGAIYDYREAKTVNLVEIDVHKLRRAIESPDVYHNGSIPDSDPLKVEAKQLLKGWGADPAKVDGGLARETKENPENWWNGVIYVKLPYENPSASPEKDGVQTAVRNWSVKLVNGSQIPNPDYARSRDIYGTTVATNVPLYVQGNYNANGSYSTGNEYNPDQPYADNYNPYRKPVETGQPAGLYPEASAALVADAVNILSNNWNDANSTISLSSRVASDTEVAAAIISGIVPSGKGGQSKFYSGGVENFPRFLENWSGKKFVYRGSMVSLYESEIANGRWGKSNVYNPPNRLWGFNTLYESGKYPPGMPVIRRFKRVNFKWLTKTEYDQQIAALML